MKKSTRFARIFLLRLSAIIVFIPSLFVDANAYEIVFEDCEYVATSTVKPEYLPFIAGGQESVIARIKFQGGLPLIRVECKIGQINQAELTKANVFSVLKQQADSVGLKAVQVFIEKNALGTVGTYTGRKRTGNVVLMQVGKVYFGDRSIFNVIAIEQLKNWPSKELNQFLSTIIKR